MLVTQSCPALCDPMNCSPPGSSVHWDSPGKNTGVGCHSLLQEIFPTQGLNPGLLHCRKILNHLLSISSVQLLSRVRLFATPWIKAYQAPPSMRFSGKNTGVGCHFLLQEIFPTQGLNPGLPHCRHTLYCLSHQGRSK